MKKLFLLLAVVGLVAVPALANPIQLAPGGESNLWEIWQANYSHINDLTDDLLVTTHAQRNARLWNEQGVSLETVEATQIWVKLLAKQAGYSQDFGYYPTSNINAEVSLFNTPPSAVGDEFYGIVGGGITPTTIGFYNQAPQVTGDTFYSQSALNPSGLLRMLAFKVDAYTWMVAWEDRRDWDYNDHVLEVKISKDPIPEPATMALLGMGLAGFALRRRFMA